MTVFVRNLLARVVFGSASANRWHNKTQTAIPAPLSSLAAQVMVDASAISLARQVDIDAPLLQLVEVATQTAIPAPLSSLAAQVMVDASAISLARQVEMGCAILGVELIASSIAIDAPLASIAFSIAITAPMGAVTSSRAIDAPMSAIAHQITIGAPIDVVTGELSAPFAAVLCSSIIIPLHDLQTLSAQTVMTWSCLTPIAAQHTMGCAMLGYDRIAHQTRMIWGMPDARPIRLPGNAVRAWHNGELV